MIKKFTSKTLAIITWLLIAATAKAQQLSINGSVTSNQTPVPNLVVTLLNAKDSALVKTDLTNTTGAFSFSKLNAGNYIVKINSNNYAPYLGSVILLSIQNLQLEPIQLKPSNKTQEKITVTAKKPLFEFKADKVLVNVDVNPTNAGANALEVLQKAPGVTIDKDGKISLKGNPSVMVYVDGRQTFLSGNDLINMLTNMQANAMETIEIMSNPPAKYDAAGNAGIINIRTKKSKAFGVNGSFNTNAGIAMGYPRFGNAVTINYRKNKVNLFGNFNQSYRENYQRLQIDRNFINSASKELVAIFSQINEPMRTNKDYSGKAGFDYFVNKKTTVGASVSGGYSPSSTRALGVISLKNNLGELDSVTHSESGSNSLWRSLSTNVNLRHRFDSTTKELTIDFDYNRYKVTDQINLYNQYFKNNINTGFGDTLLGSLPQLINIYSGKIDFSTPLPRGLNLELGLKTSFVNTTADARYDSVIRGVTLLSTTRSNYFKYNENINAAYINFTKQLHKKLNAQAGLRYENTIMDGKELTTQKTFRRSLHQLFPTVFLQYEASKKHNLTLNYGRRINRPNYADLNPFVEFMDKYTLDQGNPFLQPQFSHNIELGHTYNQFLNTSLSYNITNDIIQQVFITDPNKTETVVFKDNIASSKILSLAVNAQIPVAKWLQTNVFVQANHYNFKGLVNNALVHAKFLRAAVNFDNQMTFKKGWTANLSYFAMTGEQDGVIRIKFINGSDLGIGKSILQKKGNLRLSVRDVFFSNIASGFMKYDNVDIRFRQLRNSRVFNLSFTYRFNKGKLKAATQRRASSADDEKNRVGGS
jgi:iron complex outermembrane recepter protein